MRASWTTGKRIALTSGSEAFGVLIGALSGFLIVRGLDKDAYAQYSFLVACVTLMVGLSDIGLSNCYLPIIGNRADDLVWVTNVSKRIYGMRWRLFLPAATFVVPYWYYVSQLHTWLKPVYLVSTLLAAACVTLSVREQLCRTLLIVARRVQYLNGLSTIANSVRLILVIFALKIFVSHERLAVLMVASAAASGVAIIRFSGLQEFPSFARVTLEKNARTKIDEKVWAMMRPYILPGLFYQFQSFVTIFLVSIFAQTNSIAEIGALVRPTVVLVIVDKVAAILLFPAIARSTSKNELIGLVLKAHSIHMICMVFLLASAVLAPQYWMLLIGSQYASEENILWLAFLGAVLMNSAGFAFATLSARGRTRKQTLVIPLILFAQVCFIWIRGVADTRSALELTSVTASIFFVVQYALLYERYRAMRNEQ